MKRTGRLEFRDLGAGQWVLHTSSGRVALYGEVDKTLEGKDVEVVGKAADGMSASMVSDDAIMVESIRAT